MPIANRPQLAKPPHKLGLHKLWMAKLLARTEPYRTSLLKSLTRPEDAAHYLNACLEEEDARVFLPALP